MNDLEQFLKWQQEGISEIVINIKDETLLINNENKKIFFDNDVTSSFDNIDDQINYMLNQEINILDNLKLFKNSNISEIKIDCWKYEYDFINSNLESKKYYLNINSLLEEELVIYDLRSVEAIKSLKSINGALEANKKELLELVETEYFNNSDKYAVYCGTGNSAAKIAKKFTSLGYNVITIGGRKTTLSKK